MRRARRFLRLLLGAISLALSVCVAVLWIRSHFVTDTVKATRTIVRPTSVGKQFASCRSGDGRMYVAVSLVDPYSSVQATDVAGITIEYYRLYEGTKVGTFWQRHIGFDHQSRSVGASDWIVAAPHWLIFLVVASPPVIIFFREGRRRDPLSMPCPSCGYDLRASPTRCPECGASPSEKNANSTGTRA